jgi:hypothetical protein
MIDDVDVLKEQTDVAVINPVDEKIDSIVTTIMSEQDPSKTKDLVDLFNWNMSKKNISRIKTLNQLYDSITSQMVERVDKRADQFSNSDLLDYMKTIQGAIDLNTKNLSQAQEIPTIVHQTNNQVNINVVDSFDRAAKERILAAVQATLKQVSTTNAEEIKTEEEKIDVIN